MRGGKSVKKGKKETLVKVEHRQLNVLHVSKFSFESYQK